MDRRLLELPASVVLVSAAAILLSLLVAWTVVPAGALVISGHHVSRGQW